MELIIDHALTKQVERQGLEVIVENITDVSEEEFAELRHQGFGASDSSKILGVNPFPNGDAETLLMHKLKKFHDEEIGKKPSVRMGKELEPFVIDKLTEVWKRTVYKPNHMYGCPKTGLNVNFDGIVLEDGEFVPAEVKLISFYGVRYYDFTNSWNTLEEPNPTFTIIQPASIIETSIEDYIKEISKDIGIPAYYYTQLQQQIMALGSSKGYLAAMNVKTWTLHIWEVVRDDLVINELKNRAKPLFYRLQLSTGVVEDNEDI